MQFRARCIRCGLCGTVCENGCIQFLGLDEGEPDVFTPYIDARQRSCTLCMRCTQVCPTSALSFVSWREVYSGPLTVQLQRTGASEREAAAFDAPTSPISTVERTIYRRRLKRSVSTGDQVVLEPIQGWLAQPAIWAIPPRGVFSLC